MHVQYTMDDCAVTSGTGLPCTAAGAGRCPHWDPEPGPGPAPNATLSPQCVAELRKDCPGLQGKGATCAARGSPFAVGSACRITDRH